jgi:hypothetical protein
LKNNSDVDKSSSQDVQNTCEVENIKSSDITVDENLQSSSKKSQPKKKYKSILHELQILFSLLQCSVDKSISTSGLTTSFGWLGSEVFFYFILCKSIISYIRHISSMMF